MFFLMLWICEDAALAQLVEHIIRNDGVVGSNPIGGTTKPFSVTKGICLFGLLLMT